MIISKICFIHDHVKHAKLAPTMGLVGTCTGKVRSNMIIGVMHEFTCSCSPCWVLDTFSITMMTIFIPIYAQHRDHKFTRCSLVQSYTINLNKSNTGWPRKNATLTINNFKKTRDRMKKLCALLHIKLFSEQDDTKIVNFDEGVLILWLFF